LLVGETSCLPFCSLPVQRETEIPSATQMANKASSNCSAFQAGGANPVSIPCCGLANPCQIARSLRISTQVTAFGSEPTLACSMPGTSSVVADSRSGWYECLPAMSLHRLGASALHTAALPRRVAEENTCLFVFCCQLITYQSGNSMLMKTSGRSRPVGHEEFIMEKMSIMFLSSIFSRIAHIAIECRLPTTP
jgi:hypothetical protein